MLLITHLPLEHGLFVFDNINEIVLSKSNLWKTYVLIKLMLRNVLIILLCFNAKMSNCGQWDLLAQEINFSCKSCSLPQGGGLLKGTS